MKKPSDSEIQAFQIGLDYAVQAISRHEQEYKHCSGADLRADVCKDLMMVRHRQMMAKDALTTRMPVNNRASNHHAPFKCGVCDGSGKVGDPGKAFEVDRQCPNCDGTGSVPNTNPAAVAMMAPAQVSPNARTFLTAKGVDVIMARSRLVALHDVATMMRGSNESMSYVPWRELHDWLQEEIKATERKQAETAQDGAEVK